MTRKYHRICEEALELIKKRKVCDLCGERFFWLYRCTGPFANFAVCIDCGKELGEVRG